MRDEAVCALADAMKYNQTLTELDLQVSASNREIYFLLGFDNNIETGMQTFRQSIFIGKSLAV